MDWGRIRQFLLSQDLTKDVEAPNFDINGQDQRRLDVLATEAATVKEMPHFGYPWLAESVNSFHFQSGKSLIWGMSIWQIQGGWVHMEKQSRAALAEGSMWVWL